jgi:hypothetical protein
VVRSFALLLLSAAFMPQPSGRRGTLDPAFEKIPFDQWLGEHGRAHFRWTASVPRAELSFHQRLVTRIEIALDGRDLEARRGDGSLVFLIQITDRDGTRDQDHGSSDLDKLDENIRAVNLEYLQRAFFLPGDYRLAVAILDTGTGEHSTSQAQFRVAPPQHDLLPEAWRDLQPVEFIGRTESPDSWYLPDIHGRLQWAASVHSPARVNVILNVAVSVPAPGSRQTYGGGLAALLPTLKAISQTGSSSLSEHVELLDLARRHAVFHQDEVYDLDWPRLKASLGEANTASIDVHSLSERHHDAQFFVSQVRSLIRASEKPCVLVVLTTPVAFEAGEDLAPVSLEALPSCRVVYIRYRATVKAVRPFGRGDGRAGPGFACGWSHDRQSASSGLRSVGGYAQATEPESIRCRDAGTDDQSHRRN